MDENLVGEYIKSDFIANHPRYGLRSCNCSSVVVTLLLLGAHEFVHDENFVLTAITKMRHFNQLLYDDADHTARNYHNRRYEEIADQLEERLPAMAAIARRSRGRIGAVFTVLVASLDFGRRAGVWTPGDVLHLALHIRDHY